MLNYRQQYDLANGIFITYDSQLQKRLLHSNHGETPREKLKTFFPWNKYETVTKENFIMTCIYIMFVKSPSSFRSMVTELREVNDKEVQDMKYKIMNYQDYIGKDIMFLKTTFGANVNYQQVFRSFLDGQIQFYTVWFFILFNPDINLETIRASRTLSHVLRKLEFVMLFLTFKDESVSRIKSLFDGLEM